MTRVASLVAALLLAACAGAGGAVTATQPELWRLPHYGKASQCTPERAVRVKISDITTNIARYHRTCVTVEGLAADGWLYQDYEAIYRNFEEIKLPEAESGMRQSIDAEAIQFFALEVELKFPQVHPATITGYPVSCDIQYNEFEAEVGAEEAAAIAATGKPRDVISWLSGVCHAALFNQHIRVTHLVLPPRVPVWRMLPPDARIEDGNLRPAPADWPHAAFVRASAEKFLEAIRSNAEGKICDLLHPGDEDGCSTDDEAEDVSAARHHTSINNGFGDLARNANAQSIILSVHSAEPEPHGEHESWTSAVFCLCAAADCTALWPVDWGDTSITERRPFACVAISFDAENYGEVRFKIRTEDLGLDEPPWSPAP